LSYRPAQPIWGAVAVGWGEGAAALQLRTAFQPSRLQIPASDSRFRFPLDASLDAEDNSRGPARCPRSQALIDLARIIPPSAAVSVEKHRSGGLAWAE